MDDETDVEDFRRVMRCFPSGVVVVAACHRGTLHGMTVGSFTSVALRPRLVSFCAGKRSRTWPVLRQVGRFTVSILGADQADIGRRFAGQDADRYTSDGWSMTASGRPVLRGAVAWLGCDIAGVVAAGDHDIVLGQVRETGSGRADKPLIFYGGSFGTVA